MPVSRAEIHYDAIRDLIASGLTDSEALARDPDYPPLSTWSGWLTRHPDRKAEIVSLRPGRATPAQDVVAAKFDEVLRLIEAGANSEDAGKTCGFHHQSLHRYLRNHPDQRSRYVAAERKRESGANKRGTVISTERRRKRWKPEQFEDAVSFIRDHRGFNLQAALRSQHDLPSLESLIFRANRNPAFAARYAKAMAAHAMANAYRYIFSGGGEPSLLLYNLMQQPLYAAAWKHFRKLDDRDDFISEVVLAVLEGTITADDITKRETFKGIRRRVRGRMTESLDVPAFEGREGDSRDTLADTIASPCGIHTF